VRNNHLDTHHAQAGAGRQGQLHRRNRNRYVLPALGTHPRVLDEVELPIAAQPDFLDERHQIAPRVPRRGIRRDRHYPARRLAQQNLEPARLDQFNQTADLPGREEAPRRVRHYHRMHQLNARGFAQNRKETHPRPFLLHRLQARRCALQLGGSHRRRLFTQDPLHRNANRHRQVL